MDWQAGGLAEEQRGDLFLDVVTEKVKLVGVRDEDAKDRERWRQTRGWLWLLHAFIVKERVWASCSVRSPFVWLEVL